MLLGINNSKEIIKTRMLKHALNYWNIKHAEDLDPVVKLMLEGLSTELYNLGNEIKDTEVRLLEKIANMLAPAYLTCPNTAHAILHTSPVEPTETLTTSTHLCCKKKISSKNDEILDTTLDIFFTAVAPVRLFDAAIKYILVDNNLQNIDDNYLKNTIANTQSKLKKGNIWLGLKLEESIVDINDLYFYFDWKNIEQKVAYHNYQLLSLGKWFIGNKELDTTIGIKYDKQEKEEENIFVDNDLLSLMEKDIQQFYHHRFISIHGASLKNIQSAIINYPKEFEDYFSESDLQKLDTKLVWLKVELPISFSQEMLNDVDININCFPVMNRQLNELKYRLKGGSNIIPLKTNLREQFLSPKSLGDMNNEYISTPYRKMDEEDAGTYTLRTGGVERFDERNAKEFINYLLELLRSESSAFSAYGHDFIASTLKEMYQRIALMEQKTNAAALLTSEIPHYIIVKPFEGQEMMFVEYWTTMAEAANNIKLGTRLTQYSGSKLKSDSSFLLTSSIGGKNRLKPSERLNAFRYGLITRNRIITKEDIKNFCFYELDDHIKDVEVQKGFEMSTNPKQGFKRTIDIILTPAQNSKITEDIWQNWLDHLLSKLQTRSGMSNNYRIMLHK